MGVISATRNDLSKILLVACDQAYAPGVVEGETVLAQYLDSTGPGADVFPNTMPQAWSNLGFSEWSVFRRRDDPITGFGATVYRREYANGSADYIVAMQGTRGLNVQDWSGNLIYGWDKWGGQSANVAQALLGEVLALDDVNKIHFTGQSLGGALAEYALYDYARQATDFDPTKVTLTTFNGLGGVEALAQNRPAFSGSLVADVDTAHFSIVNDIIHRLGGGHLNGAGNEYALDFWSTDGLGLVRRREDLSPIAQDLWSAHKIESGFYSGFNRAALELLNGGRANNLPLDFTQATQKPVAIVPVGGLARTGTYMAWLSNQDGALATDTEAAARLVAAFTYGVAFGSKDDVEALTTVLADAAYAQDFVDEFLRDQIKLNAPKFFPALAAAPASLTAQIAAQMIALAAEGGGKSSTVDAPAQFRERLVELIAGANLANASPAFSPDEAADRAVAILAGADGQTKAAAMYAGATALGIATLILAIPGIAGAVLYTGISNILELGRLLVADGPSIARNMLRETSQALRETLGNANEEFSAAISAVADSMVTSAIDLSRGATVLAIDSREFVEEAKTSVANGMSDVAKALSNAYEGLQRKFTDAFEIGVPVARDALESILDFFVTKAKADTGGTGPSLDVAIDTLEFSAQLAVIGADRDQNPFDDPNFDPDAYTLSSASLAEGSVRTLTVFLPYEAGSGGQRIKLELAGAAADKLSVLSNADVLELEADGTFTLTVAEGQREVSFGLLAGADIDTDETLTLSATLVDAAGEATHLEHEEATITLHGEAESPPAGGREIRGDWAPKPYDDGEGVYYKFDDLGNIERDPDVPNTTGFQEPDNKLDGSSGSDHIVTGDYADTVFAFEGDDSVTGSDVQGTIVFGGAGNDWIEAFDYTDHVENYYEFEYLGRTIKHGEDKIYGGAGNDRIYGESEATVSALYDSSPTPTGLPGDWTTGGSGADEIYGGAGDDVLMGGVGEDRLVGGVGKDVLLGDDDYLIRPEGVFWTVVHPNFGDLTAGFGGFEVGLFPVVNATLAFPDLVFPATGDPDFTYYKNSGANDVLIGGAGDDILIGQAGDDTLYGGDEQDVLAGWEGADQLFGGEGDDLMAGDFGRHEQINQRVVDEVQLVRPGVLGSSSAYGTPVEQIGADFLDGGAGNDILFGEGGNDVLLGGDGNDTIWGDAAYLPDALHGDDLLDGGAGDDFLAGNAGSDKLYGGDGNDTLSGGLENDLLEGGTGNDSLAGDDGDDTLRGGEGADTLLGGAGADQLRGGAGDDQLDGGDDSDVLFGDAGVDQLQGGAGNDTLYGGSGEDVIEGGNGNDLIDGGAGIDIVRGGEGNDTYFVGFGYGQDLIEDSLGENRIRFGSGIRPEDLSAEIDSATLAATLTLGAAGDSVSFDATQVEISGVEFSNEVVWTKSDFVNFMPAVVSQGSSANEVLDGNLKLRNDLRGEGGNDELEGAAYSDALAGGDGDDSLDGKSGSDHYLFGATESGVDLVADAGLAARAYLDWFYSSRGITNWVERGEHGGRYRAEGEGEGGPFVEFFDTYEAAYEQYSFATITYVDPLPEIAPLITRNDTQALAELSSAGLLDSDVVELGPGIAVSELQLTITVQGLIADQHPEQPWHGGGTLSVRWGDAGFDIEVPDFAYGFVGSNLLTDGVPLEEEGNEGSWRGYRLGEGIEVFKFSDGSTYTLEEILQQATVVPRYDYVVARGSGVHELDVETYSAIRFEADISSSEVRIERDNLDLLVTLTDYSASVRVFDWFAAPPDVPNVSLRFADGPTVFPDEITRTALTQHGTPFYDFMEAFDGFQNTLHGEGSGDALNGGTGNDILDGGPDNDYMQGGGGDDTYLVGVGTGEDHISEVADDGAAGFDTIRFLEDVSPLDLTVERDYGDLVLTRDGGTDSVTVSNWFAESGGSVERVEFSDGTSWDAAAVEALLPSPNVATPGDDVLLGMTGDDFLAGLGGVDEIAGFAGSDILIGGIGDDYVDGGSGDDTFVFDLGDGADEFEDSSGNDTIDLGIGISPDAVLVARDPYSLILIIGEPGDRITIEDWFEDEASRIEQVEFADGTIWNAAELESRVVSAPATEFDDVLTGTSGDDRIDGLGGIDEIYGLEGYDVLEGGDGDDYLDGGAGASLLLGGAGLDSLGSSESAVHMFAGGLDDDFHFTYTDGSLIAFNVGDGVDHLFVNPDQSFTLSFGGASAADLTLSRSDSDVLVQVSAEDSVVIGAYGWTSSIWPNGTLQLIDGDIRTYDLNAVVQAYLDAEALEPGLANWSAEQALAVNLLTTSTTHALGGAIAYEYATSGGVAGLSTGQLHAVLGEAEFGLAPQPISVPSGNAAPELDNALADQNASEDVAFVFAVSADAFSDPDAGDELSYTASLDDDSALPSWLAFDAETRTFSGTPLQADVGAIDVKVTANDGEDLSADDTFTLTVANANDTPVVTPTAATQTLLLGQSVDTTSLFSATDEDGDAPAQYEFWDSTAGNGHFSVNGVEQGVNVAILVSAADLADTDFVGGAAAGSDLVWVRVSDGQGFGAWKSWTMNSWPHATNAKPVANAPDGVVLRDQAVLAQSLFSVSDADMDSIAQYEFWDDAAGGGTFALDGVAQSSNPIPVTAAQLADLEYVGGANPGTERVWVRANDGLEWGAWESWNMTTALHIPNAAPEATPTAATQTVLLGQSVAASGLFTVNDADADPMAQYEFWDSTAGNGHFTVDGVEQGVNVSIAVAAEDLAGVQFAGALGAGSDLVWVRVSDGQSFGGWKSWTMNSWPHATNAAPVAEAANETVLTSEVVAAGTLFSVIDADGDAAVRYEFWDDVAGGGYWRVNGVQQAAAAAVAVDAGDLADAEYVGGANPGSEQVWVRVNDGLEWGAWESWLMTTALHDPNAAPVVTAANATVLLGQSAGAASLFSVTDADADTISQYEFWDSTAGNGHFAVDGVEQGVNVSIGVTAAQLADTEFVGAASTGSDLVWVRAYDSMAWSDWKSWSMNSWPHLANAAPVVTAANAGILGNETLAAAMFFGVSDADGDAPARYEFWDDVNGGGHWALDGVQQASGQAIAVDAADLANVDYIGGVNPGTEQVWVRASDGMSWSPWKNWLMSTEGGMLRGGAGPDTLVGEAGPTVLEGGGGDDTLTDTDGDNLLSGGEGDDTMTGGDGDDLFAGGTGNDTIDTGAGSNIIAYNASSGIDTVFSGAGAANTLSFGGGIGYDELSLSKDGNDLIVSAGENDRVVLKDWYAGSESVLNLQIILDATEEFDANSSDPLYNRKVQTFDFAGMVAEFDEALAQSPGLTSWAVTNALLAFHLSGADDAVIGGDLAYWYGRNNGFTGISLAAAQAAIGAPGFGADAQTLHPFSGLQEGLVKLS